MRARVGVVALLAVVALSGCQQKRTGGPVDAGPHPSGSPAPCVEPALAASPAQASPAAPAVPDVTLPCLADGRADVRLAALGRPAVINLWASWCGPCRTELPALQAYAATGRVAVLGVATRDRRAGAESVVTDLGLTFPNLYDRDGALLRGVGRVNLPLTLFVTAAGEVAHVHNAAALDTAGFDRLAREYLGLP